MTMRALLIALMMVSCMPVMAVGPDEVLDNPALESRARDISAGLRCLVCQNQSIDDSDADLAKDLRLLVRERLVAGDSNAQVEQYIVDRYGEYVLLNPRLGGHTVLLWIAAPVLLVLGLGGLVLASRRRATPVAGELSSDEQAALDRLSADQSDRAS